ncbi:hypothetical protein ACFCW2_02565 [Qipengyuania sp. DSG2-2]|uniref:hypothetical protein n=1 Tax=Qipengyuania sp. DGS2-2 TaxID=3349631 RepID=UPI0036D31EB8
MTETSFASLSPTLLARKGGAKPAMRPQIAPVHGESPNGGAALAANLEDLGWNDMGEPHETDQPTDGHAGLTPEPAPQPAKPSVVAVSPAEAPMPVPPVKQQIEELATRIASNDSPENRDAPAAKPRRSAASRGKRAAFTLRLDSDRHLKLRLASTIRGRSAQALVTEALDKLLGDMPEVDSMAAQVPHQGAGK